MLDIKMRIRYTIINKSINKFFEKCDLKHKY